MEEVLPLEFENEKRRYPRTPLVTEAFFHCAGREFILTSRNVSAGGMQASPDPGLAARADGFISFHLGQDDLPFACRCRVVYAVDGKSVGIEFLDLAEESREVLKNFVDEAN